MVAPAQLFVRRRVRFSAARRLESPVLDEAENERLFGPDRRLHGREFELFVTLTGPAPAETAMVMDLKALSALLKAEVVAPLDHTVLNEAPMLAGLPPTTENLAIRIWDVLAHKLPLGLLSEVAINEGPDRTVTYRGDECRN